MGFHSAQKPVNAMRFSYAPFSLRGLAVCLINNMILIHLSCQLKKKETSLQSQPSPNDAAFNWPAGCNSAAASAGPTHEWLGGQSPRWAGQWARWDGSKSGGKHQAPTRSECQCFVISRWTAKTKGPPRRSDTACMCRLHVDGVHNKEVVCECTVRNQKKENLPSGGRTRNSPGLRPP